jgi:hypothetical protein
LRFDCIDDGFTFRLVFGREIRFDHADATRHVKQFLRLGEGDQHLLVADEGAPRHQADNRQFDDALGGRQFERVVQGHAHLIGEPLRDHGNFAIALFKKALVMRSRADPAQSPDQCRRA